MDAQIGQTLSEVARKSMCARQQREVTVKAVISCGGQTARLTDASTEALLEPLLDKASSAAGTQHERRLYVYLGALDELLRTDENADQKDTCQRLTGFAYYSSDSPANRRTKTFAHAQRHGVERPA